MDIQFRWIIFILLAVSKQLLFLISCPFFTLKHGPFFEELLQKIVCCCGLALQCLGAKYTNGVKIYKIYNKLISDLQGMGLCICIEFLLLFKKYSISSSKVLYAHKLQFQLVNLLDNFFPNFFYNDMFILRYTYMSWNRKCLMVNTRRHAFNAFIFKQVVAENGFSMRKY